MSERALSYSSSDLHQFMGYKIDNLQEKWDLLEGYALDNDTTIYDIARAESAEWDFLIRARTDTLQYFSRLPAIHDRLCNLLDMQSFLAEAGVTVDDDHSQRTLAETYLYWRDQRNEMNEYLA